MNEITEQDVLSLLRAKVPYGTRIRDLADHFNVSTAFMSAVLLGRKRMTKPMLAAVGVQRKVVYLRCADDAPTSEGEETRCKKAES